MSPERTSLSLRRCRICSEVSPSGMVMECRISLPDTSVSMTSRRLAFLLKRNSPARTRARLPSTTSAMFSNAGLSMTPSVSSWLMISAPSEPRAIATTLSAASGPGAVSFSCNWAKAITAPTAASNRNDRKPLTAESVGARLLGGGPGGGGGALSGCKASAGDFSSTRRAKSRDAFGAAPEFGA